jgi:hypothetical protein
MSENPKLIDWMICDDVRQEASGKISVMGIFADDIVVYSVPMVIPQLWFVTKWDISEGGFTEISLRIELPDGKPMGPFHAQAPQNLNNKRFMLYLALFPFQIQSTGDYKLYLTVDGRQEVEMGKFAVVLVDQEQK